MDILHIRQIPYCFIKSMILRKIQAAKTIGLTIKCMLRYLI